MWTSHGSSTSADWLFCSTAQGNVNNIPTTSQGSGKTGEKSASHHLFSPFPQKVAAKILSTALGSEGMLLTLPWKVEDSC